MAYFIKNIQRGDPWKILKKNILLNFFSSPPKILYNTHMKSHKKFRAKKMIFRGAFGRGLSERKKSNLAFGASAAWNLELVSNREQRNVESGASTARWAATRTSPHRNSTSVYCREDWNLLISVKRPEKSLDRRISLDEGVLMISSPSLLII